MSYIEEFDTFEFCTSTLKDFGEEEGLERLQETIDYIKEFIKEHCDIRNLCPKCYSELKCTEHEECRGEYLGTPSKEVVVEYNCPKCSYIKD